MADAAPPLPFTEHTRPSVAQEDYLANYTLVGVVSANPYGQRNMNLRTLVVQARLRSSALSSTEPTALAIKIIPTSTAAQLAWAKNEMRIHYYMSQIDAAEVRRLNDGDRMFLASSDNALEHDERVGRAIREGTSWSVVPLYDFAVRPYTFVPRSMAGSQKLRGLTLPAASAPTGYMTQRYFQQNGLEYARSLGSMAELIVFLRSVMVHVFAMLHQLQAVLFTHSDLKLDNIAMLPIEGGGQQTLWHRVAKDRWLVLPQQTAHLALFDFGFARAIMTDAAGARWQLVPDADMLTFRLGKNHGMTGARTYAPVIDVFRLVESCAGALVEKTLKLGTRAAEMQAAADVQRMMVAVLSRLPSNFNETLHMRRLREFVDGMLGDSAKQLAAAVQSQWDPVAWSVLYRMLPETRADVQRLALPWDALAELDSRFNTTTEPSEGIDVTTRPLIAKGTRYRGDATVFDNNEAFRTRPAPKLN